MVHSALWANIALMALCAFAGMIGSQLPGFVVGIELGLAACSLALLHLVRRGQVAIAGGLLLGVSFIALTLAIARMGTIRVPATGFYVALVIAAGLLSDWRGMFAMIAVSSGAVGGLIVAENSGVLPRPDYAVTITQWIASTALFACVGAWTFAALHSIQTALRRAEREVADRKQAEAELQKKVAELSEALAEVKKLSGMLPICCGCKKIRDDKNYWHQVENYVADHSQAKFTHGYCPECAGKYFPSLGGPAESI